MSFDELVDDAVRQIGGDSIWVGWSLGAMVALAAAARENSTIKGVVGVCATAKFCCDDATAMALDQLRAAVEVNPEKAVKRFQRSTPSAENRRSVARTLAELHAPQFKWESDGFAQTLLSGLEILARADLNGEVNKIDIPVKLISGLEDPIISASSGESLQRQIANSSFTALPCGHVPFLECEQLFMEQLLEFTETFTESTPG